jgi:mRNA interferase RelE/StbE
MQKDIKLTYLKKATKFLSKNKNILTEEQVDALVINFIKKKFYNIDVNIDYKQMKGTISDIYRIRKANLRILVSVTDDEIIIEAIVEDIGYRGDIYKKL